MADLGEAFNILKLSKTPFNNIDYFFTQRTLVEEKEYIDKNMTRQIKKIKVTNNFLALNIPNFNNKSLDVTYVICGFINALLNVINGIVPIPNPPPLKLIELRIVPVAVEPLFK
jgi:hypothetical protein